MAKLRAFTISVLTHHPREAIAMAGGASTIGQHLRAELLDELHGVIAEW